MINSFGTGKRTEADGSGRGTGKRTEAAAAVRAVRAAAALLPRMASGERSEAPPQQETAAAGSSSLFLCCCFCGCRLSAAAARAKSTDVMVVLVVVLVGHQRRGLSSPAWPAASGAKPPPQQETAAAGSSSFLFLVLLFLWLLPSSAAARALLPRMASGERSEAPTAAGAGSSSNSRFQQLTGDIRNGTEYLKHHLRHHRVAVSLYGLCSPSGIRNGETVHIKGKPIMSATYRGDSWKISPSFLGIFSLTRRANVGRSFAFFPRERFTRPVPLSIAVGVGSSAGRTGWDLPMIFTFSP